MYFGALIHLFSKMALRVVALWVVALRVVALRVVLKDFVWWEGRWEGRR